MSKRYKEKLVVRGFTQKEGVDFNDVFSPIVKHISIGMLLAMVAKFDLELEQMDVNTAILYALSAPLYETACSLTVQDANICLTLLKSDSRIISATNYDDLSKYILELAVKESNAVQDYMVNLASVYFSDLAITECAQQIYPKIIEAFKRALGEFDKDPQSAKNDIKAAGNGPGDCEKVIQNEGKHKDLSTKDQNSSSSNTHRKLDTTVKVTEERPSLAAIGEASVHTNPDLKKDVAIPEKPLPWVEIIKGNRVPSNGIEISYTAPDVVNGEIEVSIDTQDIASELQYWENSLVMYVIGEDLSMNAVRKFMLNMWNFISLPELYYNNEGYFIIRFNSKSDRDMVLVRGLYTIHRKPMFLHEWKADFKMLDDMIRTLPLWVMFPQLPLMFWGEKSIGKISSALGKPLMTDECTAKKLRVSYARVLIEIDVTKELPQYINIREPSGVLLRQDVEYEWRPQFCTKCNKVGHECKENTTKEPVKGEQRWEPKPKQQPIEKKNAEQTVVAGCANEDPKEWIEVRSSNKSKGKEIDTDSLNVNFQNRARHVEIAAHLRKYKVSCAGLLETRVKEANANKIRKKISTKWQWIDNYKEHTNGRICWPKERLYGIGFKVTQEPWMILGDFNNVMRIGDRVGGHPVQSHELSDLEEMMSTSDLFVHDSTGSRFTWSNKHSHGLIYSKIDHVICNASWFLRYPKSDVEFCQAHISDHSPIIVKIAGREIEQMAHRQFKFLNCIAEQPQFGDIVTNSWNSRSTRQPQYQLWHKLMRLKPELKRLIHKVTEGVRDIQNARQQLEQVEQKLAQDLFNINYLQEVQFWSKEVIQKTECEEQILKQKSKVTWLQLGDGNTSYFHAIVKGKNKQTGIQKLEDSTGQILTEHKDIEMEILSFYKGLIGTTSHRLKHVDIVALRTGSQLAEEDRMDLGIGDNKAPGEDGYTARFFKAAWNTIKQDVCSAIRDFFEKKRLHPALNCALVTLIPKSPEAKNVKNLRPIACCTTVYKIISKILTKRLSKCINKIVHDSQSAFIPGKVIQDNIILAHELLRGYSRKHISPRCAIQMDIQKAYDTVEWHALESIMREMSFPPTFVDWIMICVRTVSYKYVINGKPSPSIQAKRGLRQGDPISPLLFVLIMEYLHRSLRKLQYTPSFHFHPKCKKLGITNLCFADDLMMFSRGDPTSVQTMMQEFHKFSEATGLWASQAKCKVYCGGIKEADQQQILQITGFSAGSIPFKYLGVPLSSRRLTIHHCRTLVDRILAKIQHWTAKLLSYAGRYQLIRSVLFGVTSYWLNVFPIPKGVLKHIEAMCRSFLWKGNAEATRKAPVTWDSVCNPKRARGLNITSLKEWNIASMGKLFWNIQAKADKLWVKWVNTYYLKHADALDWQHKNCSWILANVFKCRDKIKMTAAWSTCMLTGSYKTASFYDEIRGDRGQVDWNFLLCKNFAKPRARFVLWLSLLGRLSTKDRLRKHGSDIDDKCVFCNKEETLNHLFFECSDTRQTWSKVLCFIGYHRIPLGWNQEMTWAIAETKRKGWRRDLLKIALTECVYGVWRQRNDMVFNHTPSDLHLWKLIVQDICIRSTLHKRIRHHVNLETMSISP
ncbi:uncharacterized protein LOC131650721 [Vicia villosa]|uniref:uncharacterized protein LOC131650721 n=1 Tax=Vicia villosa TaxID=3911 RepID=UPI00273B94FB|nr:uncharacterized protein LOC131650721 [Vicia villosa]